MDATTLFDKDSLFSACLFLFIHPSFLHAPATMAFTTILKYNKKGERHKCELEICDKSKWPISFLDGGRFFFFSIFFGATYLSDPRSRRHKSHFSSSLITPEHHHVQFVPRNLVSEYSIFFTPHGRPISDYREIFFWRLAKVDYRIRILPPLIPLVTFLRDPTSMPYPPSMISSCTIYYPESESLVTPFFSSLSFSHSSSMSFVFCFCQSHAATQVSLPIGMFKRVTCAVPFATSSQTRPLSL